MTKTEEITIPLILDSLYFNFKNTDRESEITSNLRLALEDCDFIKYKDTIVALDIDLIFESEKRVDLDMIKCILNEIGNDNLCDLNIKFDVDPEEPGIYIKVTYNSNTVMIQPYEK